MELFEYTDIGIWRPYNFLLDEEQFALQTNNLISVGIENGDGLVKFTFSKYIAKLNDYLEKMSDRIRIEDTTVSLENEIYYTSKIEGAKTTRVRTSEIHNGAPIREGECSERMVKNGFDAVKLLTLYGYTMSEEKLLSVWNVLVDGVCENESIRGKKYRNGPVYVGGHEGVEFTKLDELMKGFLSFYNSPKMNQYPFVKACLLHYVFETIHPFCDGNGRMGRLLINNYLLAQGIDSAKAVSFSMQIDATRGKYDAAFVDSENEYNDCTPFLEYMLTVMCTAYETAFQLQKEKEDIEY